MTNHIVGEFAAARWLLGQATFEYLAIIPLAIVCTWTIVQSRRRPRAMFTMVLPVFWLLPIALAGVFTDWKSQEPKTAGWVGEAALFAMALQIAASALIIFRLKGDRVLAVAAVLVNGVIGLFALFVVGMDASGDWI